MRTHSQKLLSSMPSAGSLRLRSLCHTGQFRFQKLLVIAMFAALSCAPVFARLHHYNKIVVFGDSLSDTGNVAQLFWAKYAFAFPSPQFGYTYGRFTDGYDTTPPAINYSGVWIEQLAKDFPNKPPVRDSLDPNDPGTNYAYGDALTGDGYTTLSFVDPYNNTEYSVQVANIGQQINDYLQTKPAIDKHTLFVVWGGANNVLQALQDSSIALTTNDIFNAAYQETIEIQRLIQAGATQILVPNLPPLGLVPRLNQSATTKTAGNAAAQLYNTDLAAGISLLKGIDQQRHISFYQLDVYDLMKQVVASPGKYSLTNVTDSAELDAETQTVDPDTFLFWDDLHPTTRGHNIMANAAFQLLSK